MTVIPKEPNKVNSSKARADKIWAITSNTGTIDGVDLIGGVIGIGGVC